MLVSVVNKFVRLQREFLWDRQLGVTKISWVKWEKVCGPKRKEGLGIRNLGIFNESLLAK